MTAVGLFAPINESTWEHLKLIFYPTVLYSAAEYFLLKVRPENYLSAVSAGLYAGMLAIVAFFYTYSGILGFFVPFLNIFSFFFGVVVMLCVKSAVINHKLFCSRFARYAAIYFLARSVLLFVLFTLKAPTLGVFIPPPM